MPNVISMPYLGRLTITLHFLGFVCLALLGTSLMASCSMSQRQETIHTSVVLVDGARDGFETWDLAHQQSIVTRAASREEALKEIVEYRAGPQALTMNSFTVAYRALAVAATQTDDLSFNAALSAATALVDSVKALIAGGPIPAIPTIPAAPKGGQ